MHSIVMPSSPAFLTTFSFIASPTPCYPFLPLTMLQPPLKKTRYPDAKIPEVPSHLVSCNPMTSQPFAEQVLSRVSMCSIPLTPLTAAVRTLNVPNVSFSSRDLALAALCFLRAGFLSARFPRRFYQANKFRLSLNSRCFLPRCLASFFRRVGCGTPTTPLIVDTFAYSRVLSEHSSSPRFEPPVFRGGDALTLLPPQARLPRETISLCWGASPPVDAVGRLALSASTSSRINRCPEGTFIHARTLELGRRVQLLLAQRHAAAEIGALRMTLTIMCS